MAWCWQTPSRAAWQLNWPRSAAETPPPLHNRPCPSAETPPPLDNWPCSADMTPPPCRWDTTSLYNSPCLAAETPPPYNWDSTSLQRRLHLLTTHSVWQLRLHLLTTETPPPYSGDSTSLQLTVSGSWDSTSFSGDSTSLQLTVSGSWDSTSLQRRFHLLITHCVWQLRLHFLTTESLAAETPPPYNWDSTSL